MARTDLAVQQIDADGLTPAYTAAIADGHAFPNDVGTFVHVKNGGAGAVNVTVPTPSTRDGLAVADRTVTVAAGAEAMIGPFPSRTYDQADGKVHVDYDVVTSVTVAVLKT